MFGVRTVGPRRIDPRVLAGRTLRSMLSRVADLTLPTDCFVCGSREMRHQRLGSCLGCWTALTPMRRPVCSGCGESRPGASDLAGPGVSRCGACLTARRSLDGVRAAVRYDDVARTFLLRVKARRRGELLVALGDQLAAAVRASGVADGCDVVVPVPAHPWARLRRGFNPAARLARAVADSGGLPYRGAHLSRRWSSMSTSKKLPARARRPAVEEAFRVGRRIPGCSVLVVDDVMTTGATLEACARVLKASGAREVRAAVWARAQQRTAAMIKSQK